MKIKTGDNVTIITGKDRGKSGKVLRVLRGKNRVFVEGINLVKRHKKGEGIVDENRSIDASNVRKDDK